jgi:hypothetical protein
MGRTLRRWQGIALAAGLVLVAGCGGAGAETPGSDARAAARAKAYLAALGTARWDDAYSMLLPRQRDRVDRGNYGFNVRNDISTGATGKASVNTVRSLGKLKPPGYSVALPTKSVSASIRYDPNNVYGGRIRVSNLNGRWFVSLSDAAWTKYRQGNGPRDAVWEYREAEPDASPPTVTQFPTPVPAAPPGSAPTPGPATPSPTP